MSQGPSQGKATTSRAASSSASSSGSRLLQNYPQEPIGTRPSYVGELIAILRDGTPELRGLLETECDLRFNCKVCGSILPSTRSFVIHKRQFCTTKYVEYQRKNVAILERISNVVSFETRGLQTGGGEDRGAQDMLELLPLPGPLQFSSVQFNGVKESPLRENGCDEEMEEAEPRGKDPRAAFVSKDPGGAFVVPAGVEIIQPSRPPADGVYRFGMGGMSLMANKKKKTRVHASGSVKKKRKQIHAIRDNFSSPKRPPTAPIMTVTKATPQKVHLVPSKDPKDLREPKDSKDFRDPKDLKDPKDSKGPAPLSGPTSSEPSVVFNSELPKTAESFKRSRRLGPPINGFSMDRPAPSLKPPNDTDDRDSSSSSKGIADMPERNGRDVKDPSFIRRLLKQMCAVADHQNKKCKECNRNVVSVYNLDRHVATQHLGLKESEYSLISKELRRLRAELFDPSKDVSESDMPASDMPDSVTEDVSAAVGGESEGADGVDGGEGEETEGVEGEEGVSRGSSEEDPQGDGNLPERGAEEEMNGGEDEEGGRDEEETPAANAHHATVAPPKSRSESGRTEPTGPSRIEPIRPSRIEPIKPTRSEPSKLSRTEPTKPERTESIKPSRTEPAEPGRAKPTEPGRTEPTESGRTEPGRTEPTTSKTPSSDSEAITERLTAMMRNPDTLKEILTTKEKEQPVPDYELEQLVEIQRQILDAADPFLQCCRICTKQYFDVYVLNRHIMTVHLRLPERSCGAINKMIKDSMKRFPDAFGTMVPLADSLAD